MSTVFSQNLRSLMNVLRLNQKELAKEIGITDAAVSNWFVNDGMPSGEQLVKLEVLFGVTGSELLTEDDALISPQKMTGLPALELIAQATRLRAVAAKLGVICAKLESLT